MAKYIAIDLDSQGVFAVSGVARGGNVKVDHAVAWEGTEGEPPPALTADTARQIGDQIRERLKAAGIGAAPVLVIVGRDRIVLKELRYPAVPPAEEPNIVRFQALKELSDAADDVVLDYTPMSNGAPPEGERQSMAVVIRKDLYGAIQSMCAAANLRLAAVTPRPYAVAAGLQRAFATSATTPPEAKTDAVAALTLGPGGGEFTVVRNGEVTFTVAVPAPVVSSEPMLLAQLRRNLTVYAGANPAHPIQALYVAEAGGWAGRFRAALGIPVHTYDPLAGSVPTVPEPIRGRFAGAVGLLAAKSTSETLPINFALPRQPKAAVDPKRKQIMLAVLAAIVILGLGGFFGYMKLSAADDELAQLTSRKKSLEDDITRLEPDAKRLAATRQWQSRRVVWLDELFDLADRFPEKTDGFHAISFHGQSLQPDQKTGKQESQAEMTVKIAAKDGSSADALLHALEADNTNPKQKHYVGWLKSIGGAVANAEAREITLKGRVNNRSADLFTRQPVFIPPVRKNYPPVVVPIVPKDVLEPEQPEKAPEPRGMKPADNE